MILPFLIRMSITLAAGGSGRMSYLVSSDEEMEIISLQQKATGAFDIYGITDSRGMQYSNAAPGSTMDRDFIQNAASSNIGLMRLPVNIVIPGGVSLNIDVIDTSAAGNTVEMVAAAIRKIGENR